jgi:ribosomal protein L29
MKRNDLLDTKKLNEVELVGKIKLLKKEIADLVMDRNMNKLTDLKSIGKKRKEIAQIMTIIRQKQLINEFEVQKGEVDAK